MKKNRTIVFLLVVFLLLIVVFVKMLSTNKNSEENKQHEDKTENAEVKKNETPVRTDSGSKTDNSPNKKDGLVVKIRKPQTGGNSGNTGEGKVEEGKTGTGGNSGGGKTGGTTVVEKDSDGDGFVDAKDKCPHEFGEINGCPDSDGDGVPNNKDKCIDKPGPASNYGCPKPVTISVDLAMNSQNNFTWNSKVAEEGLKVTLVFQTNSGAEFRKDVTGLSSFKFKSGDTRFDGVMTNVELIITTKEGVKVTGTTKIKTRTTC